MGTRRRDANELEPTYQPSIDEPLIDTRTLAEWLGVSEHTIRKWIGKGPEANMLPRTLRINGQIRFRRSDVRDWIESRTIK